MKKAELESKTRELYDRLLSFLGYDFKAEQEAFERTGRSVINGDYDIKRSLLEMGNFIDAGKPEQALSAFDSNLHRFLSVDQIRTKAQILNKTHGMLFDYFEILREILELLGEFMSTGLVDFVAKYRTLPFFTQEELDKEDITPEIQVFVERALSKKLFKTYRYKESESELDPNDTILFYPNVGISENIEAWLNFLSSQTDFMVNNPDKIVATLFLKLDDIEPHFSSFIVTIHKGESIWVCTDKLEFSNPYNKIGQAARGHSSGKIARKKEEHYNNIGLPYRLAFDMDAIRGSQIIKADSYERIDLKSKVAEAFTKALKGCKNFFDDKRMVGAKVDAFFDIACEELTRVGLYPTTKKVISADHFGSKITGMVLKAHYRPDDRQHNLTPI